MARAKETVGGRYELLDVLGRGGMGVVYRARDSMLDRIVAVKVLPAALAEVGTLVERFEREARAAARLNHPNIVGVYDTGVDRGARYIVMECVPGQSLAQRIAEGGPLDAPHAVEIAAQAASALAAAHAAGIIHRDIKPGNIMVQPTGGVKVLDFGIARATTDAALTSTTTLLGSAPYMAPEVALGQPADARSDIYSLGCVLYEMLTGRPPFVGDLPVAVMNQHTSTPPQPPRQIEPSIPSGVEALVLQMLAKDPEARPQQSSPLVSALRASLRAPVVAPETLATQAIGPPTEATRNLEPPTAATRWQPREAEAGAAAGAAAAGGAAAAAARPRGRRPPPRRSGLGEPWVLLLALIIALIAGVAVAVALVGSSSNPPARTAPPRTEVTTGGGAPAPTSPTHGNEPTTTTSPPPTTPPPTTAGPPTTTTPTTPTAPTTTRPTGTTTAP